MFHMADPADIKEGRLTDVYFERTLEVLKAKGINKHVRAEIFAKTLPDGYGWAVLAGVEEVVSLMEGKKAGIRGLAEGTVFLPWEPVMEVSGMYQDLCVFETAMLGLLCQSSGIATKAARIRIAAGDRTVVSFGARRMHPAIAPMIERAAYIGGCDGVAVGVSARLIGGEPMGTMPHALILVVGDTVEAVKYYDEAVDRAVKRVALIDTYNDEKFEAIRVAEALGKRLFAVRLDTPKSRRGNFFRILEEVRWELDLRGFKDVKLFVSGGLDEKEVLELKPLADAFGVGTSISAAPVIDFSLDIIEIDGKPVAKKGKWSGAKDVMVCNGCASRKVVPLGVTPPVCECGGAYGSILEPILQDGRPAKAKPGPKDIRDKVLKQLERLCL